MMFVFGILGIATASYLVLKCMGEIAQEIRHEHYKKQRLVEQQFEQPPEVKNSPELRVVGWPEGPRRKRKPSG